MNTRTDIQILRDSSGHATFAVLPIAEYEALLERARATKAHDEALIPHAVVNLMFDGAGMSAARAWREHLNLTQKQVAARMSISQAALAQMERATTPRKVTRERLAAALGIRPEQLAT
ncbi:MAG: helix-turn-helix domain-containing protein [Gammaproteobacteria bacterium]